MHKFLFFPVLSILVFFTSCKFGKSDTENRYVEKDGLTYYSGKKSNHVVYQLRSDPENLNFMQHSTTARSEIFNMIHANVYEFEYGKVFPGLAKDPLKVEADGLTYNVELHPDAKWEDGKPLTAEDVLFSLKMAFCPLVGSSQLTSYLEYFKDFRIDANNSKKFQLEMKRYYIGNEWFLSNIIIVDSRVYDPQNVLASYTLADFMDENKKWDKEEKLQAFAKEFNSPKFATDPKFIKGMGPYYLVEWKPGESLTLKKKENFWAKNMNNKYCAQFPDSITYRIVKEEAAAEMAFRQGQLDVSNTLPSAIFKKFQEDKQILADYNLYTGRKESLTYLCFNTRPDGKKHKKIFDDVQVRNAMRYLIPLDNIIQTYLEGFAERTCSPFSKSGDLYNQSLIPTPYLPAKGDSLLAAAGWKDSDGDKVLDKMINGKKESFIITITYPKSNKAIEPMILRIKSEFEKAGIKIEIDAADQATLTDKAKKHDFDACFMANNTFYDLKEGFHTSSWNGGSNFSGWGNAQTDKLIDQWRTTSDKKQLKILADSLQKIIFEEAPILYFYNPKGKLIVHKRFNYGDKLTFERPRLNTLEMRQ